jgi:hypothetical protein
MPGGAHEAAHRYFTEILRNAAIRLTGQILPSFGCNSPGSKSESHGLAPLSHWPYRSASLSTN